MPQPLNILTVTPSPPFSSFATRTQYLAPTETDLGLGLGLGLG